MMKMPTEKRIYRDLDAAVISGVCAGVARYLDVDTLWVRVAAAAALIFVPFIALVAYFAAVVLLPRIA
ncbi:phage-shock protein [Alteromonas australica]|jgi:phage shock protein C|uniref:Phage-shock protein n=2 Tax=Alteromonas australica TaxID=589873 RepID=A0A075P525_9ALTE|nr:PspC domain-containing protein [Alteromonas australica]AIG00061.1 phage-shock protein [Alteromonas australica]AJP45017.1 phage-shock protein [Alteromonas australica]|tara:strand:- start:8231 stop:8434 length:204 start_codon:yes stop_codon:yes gene_type:complete